MLKKSKPWTAKEDEHLLQLRASGRSSISIAAALKRSTKAVDGRLHELRKRSRELSVDAGPKP
jgi:DNA-directed RNA polymerase specialized sigma24 family protein